LLSGVPVVVKPATVTAWLTQRMVADVINAGILPKGALSVVCGSSAGLQDALEPFDMVSFTGSAHTASIIRSHPKVAAESVRVNIEADSLNSALLMPGEAADSDACSLLIKEVVREMTVKSGQKCTAIRRIFVPNDLYSAVADTLAAKLAKVSVGNPRNENVRMGSLVGREQLESVREGIDRLAASADILHAGSKNALIDADPSVGCFVGPTLLGLRDPDTTSLVHDVEVFGPVATLVPYRDLNQAAQLIRRGKGSLVTSLYGSDNKALAAASLDLADSHGRLHVISPDVADSQTGHGNVMPQSLHGGPGRAGGGEELGGTRALGFYHRRAVLQASTAVLGALPVS
jgi:3,4-dehydroadipyl-CoA semialdehyde dehydrogenase